MRRSREAGQAAAALLGRCCATFPFPPPPCPAPRRVVVTGIGLVTPLAASREASWRRLLAGAVAARPLAPADVGGDASLASLPVRFAALVPRGELQYAALSEAGRHAPFTAFALAAAAEALADARWCASGAPGRTGVALGSGMGHPGEVASVGALLAAGAPRRVSPFFVPRVLVSAAAGAVSQAHGLRGPLCAPASACASAAHALADAASLVRHGAADVMLAGGAEACVEAVALVGFARQRALSPCGLARPFDALRDGFVLAEGAAVLVLEAEEHARRRGARVYAELRGCGLAADAHHVTHPPADGRGAGDAMRAALAAGGLPAAAVGYVNAHATGTPAGDAAEASALLALFGGGAAVGSTKGATGHLLGAAGGVEAAFVCLALRDRLAPHTAGLLRPDPGLPQGLRLLAQADGPQRLPGLVAALSNSFAFGGINVSLLFAAWPGGRPPEADSLTT